MATIQVREDQPQLPRRHEEELTAEVAMTGSVVETIGGIGAIVLAIVALAGVLPMYLAAIAAITLGVALVFEGISSAARFSKLMAEGNPAQMATVETTGGMSAELVCGAAGVVLGILALLNIVPMVLLPVSAIVIGAGLVCGAGARSRLSRLMNDVYRGHEFMRVIVREAIRGAVAAEFLIGVGGAILGILALTGHAPLILVEVAFLAVGVAVLLGGAALSGKLVAILHG